MLRREVFPAPLAPNIAVTSPCLAIPKFLKLIYLPETLFKIVLSISEGPSSLSFYTKTL